MYNLNYWKSMKLLSLEISKSRTKTKNKKEMENFYHTILTPIQKLINYITFRYFIFLSY